MLRGTLADNAEDTTVAQFPGQDPQAQTLDNSKGFAVRYTTVCNQLAGQRSQAIGYTRIKSESTGSTGVNVTNTLREPRWCSARPQAVLLPHTTIVDDLTWNKGRHTVQTGINFRMITNDRMNMNNYPSYSYSRNTMKGLGADIVDAVTAAARAKYGNSALRLTEGTQLTNAMGTLFGIINRTASRISSGVMVNPPLGSTTLRSFGTEEYEFYVQDTFKVRRDLTLTYGVRYGMYEVPYEKNGVQVNTIQPLDQFFAERVGGSGCRHPELRAPVRSAHLRPVRSRQRQAGLVHARQQQLRTAPCIAYAPTDDSMASQSSRQRQRDPRRRRHGLRSLRQQHGGRASLRPVRRALRPRVAAAEYGLHRLLSGTTARRCRRFRRPRKAACPYHSRDHRRRLHLLQRCRLRTWWRRTRTC